MRILLITNLYPPQELGGYGRSMKDFAWGLRQLGHKLTVVCSNAPYLEINQKKQEYEVNRNLLLKGSFENGVSNIIDPTKRAAIDSHNIKLLNNILENQNWDGILIGNIDLIGHEILPILVEKSIPVLHHIGFIEPSFSPLNIPKSNNYKLISASYAVQMSLHSKGFFTENSSIIYPGARVELFGEKYTKRKLPDLPDGSFLNPLCIAFAGLLMSSKGLHTLIEALIILKNKHIFTRTHIAGADYQKDYKSTLKKILYRNGLEESVIFTGSLNRSQLARFFRLNHVFVFPSIYPEAFGIVQAEAMASNLAIISTGVGGSKEMLENGKNGFLFEAENPKDLSEKLFTLIQNPDLIKKFGFNSNQIAITKFNTMKSAEKIEEIFLKMQIK